MEIPQLASAQIRSPPAASGGPAAGPPRYGGGFPPAYRGGAAGGAGAGAGAGAAGREEARQGSSGGDNQRHSLGSSLDGSSEFGESTDVLNLL
jgi:hypothetical protein